MWGGVGYLNWSSLNWNGFTLMGSLNETVRVQSLGAFLVISVFLVSIKCKGKRRVTKSSRDR